MTGLGPSEVTCVKYAGVNTGNTNLYPATSGCSNSVMVSWLNCKRGRQAPYLRFVFL
jgi:hypothetical protein